jgi:hypothetical protein
LGSKAGREMFYISSPGSPANTLSVKWKAILGDPSLNRWHKSVEFGDAYEVEVATLDAMITKYGKPYFVKIDVEGYEKQVFDGLNVPIPVMCFEANFPDFLTETLECMERIHEISPGALFNVIDDRMEYLWDGNRDKDFAIGWLKNTELRYFEIFCFS